MSARAEELFPDPTLDQVAIDLESSDFAMPSDLENLSCWGKSGWALFTRGVVLTEDRPADLASLGWLLQAEWLDGKTSHTIRPDPVNAGRFLQTRIGEQGRDRAWREIVHIAGHKAAAGRTLTYHVYLAEDADGAVRRLGDAFFGFAGEMQ